MNYGARLNVSSLCFQTSLLENATETLKNFVEIWVNLRPSSKIEASSL